MNPAAPTPDDRGFSEETCVRCGWRMGSPPLNCNNDNTPHVFSSQLSDPAAPTPDGDWQYTEEATRPAPPVVGRAAELAATVREALENTIRSVDGYTGPDVWWKVQVEAALAALSELAALAAKKEPAGTWARITELQAINSQMTRHRDEQAARAEAAEAEITQLQARLTHTQTAKDMLFRHTEAIARERDAAEAEAQKLRAALEQIKQELGHVTQTPAQAATTALAVARAALDAPPRTQETT